MAANTISILIQAQDSASKVLKDVGNNIEGAGKKSQESAEKLKLSNGELVSMAAVSAGAGLAVHSLAGIIGDSISSANNYQNAMAGLSSIAAHFHVDADSATAAAQKLSSDGLMTVTDAARGLKNLLASGFSLPEAIQLMERFKDSAAFNRQASLGFGEAISSATEGIKNGNCLVGETPILMASGETVSIEALYKRSDSFKVYSLMPDGSVKHSAVSHVISNGIKPVYTLELTDGKKIRATDNHRFLTPEGWKFLKDLTANDLILTIDNLDVYNTASTCREVSPTSQESVTDVADTISRSVQIRPGVQTASAKTVNSAASDSPSGNGRNMPLHASVALRVEANIPLNELEAALLTGVADGPIPTQRVNSAGLPSAHSVSFDDRASAAGVPLNAGLKDASDELAQTARGGNRKSLSSASGAPQLFSAGRQLPTKLASAHWLAETIGRARSAWQEKTIRAGRVASRFGSLFEPQLLTGAGGELSLNATTAYVSDAGHDLVGKISMPTTSSSSAKTLAEPLTSPTDKSSVETATSIYMLNTSKVVSIQLDGWEEVYDLSVPETRNFIAAGMVVHNSILVDNAGVTKNLSVILTEAGYSAQDLMKATTDAGVRQALFNGILKETNPMMGDANKLSHQFAGSQAKLAAQTQVTAQKFGQAMQPALLSVMNVVTPLVMRLGDWMQKNPRLTSTIVIITGSLLALTAGLGIVVTSVGIFSQAFLGAMKVAQMGLLLVSMNPLVAAIIAGTLAIAALGAAFGLFSGQSDATKSAVERHTQAQRDLTQAQKDAKQATRDLEDANLGLEGANLRVEGAQARVAQALKEYGPHSLEYRQAVYDEKTAEHDLADQKRRVADATDAKAKANQKVIDQEKAVKDSSARISNQVNQEKDAWIGLGDAAGKAREKAGGAKAGTVFGDQLKLPSGTRIPGFATGTSHAPGGTTLVGEMGPEIVNMPKGAQVVPAYRTRAQGSTGGGTVLNVGVINNYTETDNKVFLTDIGLMLRAYS